MAKVTIRDVRKNYGNVEVIHGVDVDIEDGEFVVLVGPSGCGKSTLLRMIAGLEDVTGGMVAIGKTIVNNLPPAKRDIAMVFQSYALYPHMTVAENIGYGLKVAGVPRAQRRARIAEIAGSLGLADYLDRKPGTLSGGQRQRVAIARALAYRAIGPALAAHPILGLGLPGNAADLWAYLRQPYTFWEDLGPTGIWAAFGLAGLLLLCGLLALLIGGPHRSALPPPWQQALAVTGLACALLATYSADAFGRMDG